MEPLAAHKQASQVTAESGHVIIDGPDGVAVTMSPDAAEETAKRLVKAVHEARRQTDGPGTGGSSHPTSRSSFS